MGLSIKTIDDGWVGVDKSAVLTADDELAETKVLNSHSDRYGPGDRILVYSGSRLGAVDLETLNDSVKYDIDSIEQMWEDGYEVKDETGTSHFIGIRDVRGDRNE